MVNKQKILFRADAGAEIGYGHFIRTLALADMLRDDFGCVFYTQAPSEYQRKECEKICPLVELPADDTRFQLFLNDLQGDEIVVLDNYFYATEYQKAIKNKGCKLVCIDDMHDKHYYADVVINHALTDTSLFDVEPYTRLCLGFEYALLRAPFLKPVPQHQRNNDLVVNFGGSDFLRITDKVVSMILKLGVTYNIKVILGDKAQISEENSNHVTILRNLSAEQMAEVFETSSVGILSASTVSIEAISRGLPLIIGYYVDNQKDYYKKLCADERVISVDALQDLTEEKIKNALDAIGDFKPHLFNSYEIKPRYVGVFKQLKKCNCNVFNNRL